MKIMVIIMIMIIMTMMKVMIMMIVMIFLMTVPRTRVLGWTVARRGSAS